MYLLFDICIHLFLLDSTSFIWTLSRFSEMYIKPLQESEHHMEWAEIMVLHVFSVTDFVFCSLHRLPELHNCDFDHKEDGRREAREKMVKPTRHLGTSFQRLDPDSWRNCPCINQYVLFLNLSTDYWAV